ncbi:hypothetical protein D3C80_1706710 [compost metagenome]
MAVLPLGHALGQLRLDLLCLRLILDREADIGEAHGRGRLALVQAEIAARPAGAGRQQQAGARNGRDRPHQAETHEHPPRPTTLGAIDDRWKRTVAKKRR